MKRYRLLAVGVVVGLVVCASVLASRPSEWVQAAQKEFLEGEADGVSVTSDGRLVLAPRLDLVLDTGEALVHSLAVDRTGNIFVGTGSNGKIFRISTSGETTAWADLEENGVFGLVVDSNNRLYAATGPGGKVYRLSGSGEAEVLASPRVKYIWDLAIDSGNNLYLATGPEGIIYKLDPQGNETEYYDSKDTHVVSLGWDLNGNLLAGTAPEGLLIRVSGEENAFVLYDSSLAEIKAMATDRYGNIFSAGLASGSTADAKASSGEKATAGSSNADTTESTVSVEGSGKGGKVELYRVSKEGLVETIYNDDSNSVFDLLVQNDGSVLMATGGKGRILLVSPEKLLRLLSQVPDEQATVLLETRGTLYVGTGNLGKVYRLQPASANQGSFESKVLDAGMLSEWGKLRWEVENRSGTAPAFFTRSGNTEEPDRSWSEWQGPYSEAGGSEIRSPAARYLQWRVDFVSDGEVGLTSEPNAVTVVAASYLQRNMGPEVSSLTVHAPGAALVSLPTASQGGISVGGPDGAHERSLPDSIRKLGKSPEMPPREVFHPGARSFSWTASDPNGDDLLYTLYLSRENEGAWRKIAADLSDSFYTLDGASLPDGVYRLKVEASDRPSNPANAALTGDLVSKRFVISNDPPRLEISPPRVQAQEAVLQVRVSTSSSRVFQLEYSLDARNWQIVYPKDGIADSESEEYEVQITGLASGQHSVSLRVFDTVGNIGTGIVAIRVP